HQSQSRLSERQRPRFVSPDSFRDLTPVPLLQSAPDLTQSSTEPYAIVAGDPGAFVLFSDGRASEHFELPTYNDRMGEAGRIFLTPVTVTADLTIVGG